MKHCLVVDDSRVVRRVARRILEELDFEISEAKDGKIALDACRCGMPDAILLDWSMPNMSGIEFLRALRQENDGDKPIVVLCATENDMSFMAQAIEAGANECIMKPFNREIIESKFTDAGLIYRWRK